MYGEKECRDQVAACSKRFEKGAETFAEMKAEIRHLQEKDDAQNGTWKDNKAELSGRVKHLENEVNEIKLSFAKSTNKILTGISLACILLAINIAISYF